MAYYDALIAAWNGATQPPAGVTGTAITGGMTTDQKIAAVNSWTVTGSIPTTVFSSGSAVANCIVWSEFAAITAAAPDTVAQKQLRLLTLLNNPGPLKGGSANTGDLLVGMLLDCFAANSQTIANLTAMSKGLTQSWWSAPVANGGGGLNGTQMTLQDAQAAGLS